MICTTWLPQHFCNHIPAIMSGRGLADFRDVLSAHARPNPCLSKVCAGTGILPSKDNFRSSSVPQINGNREANPIIQALTSVLSGGPVGPSDEIGKSSVSILQHVCRWSDGYIHKPSAVATPLDLTFRLGFDQYAQGLDSMPFVQHAYSEVRSADNATLTWNYLFAVDLSATVTVRPDDLRMRADSSHIAFEYFSECWRNDTAVEKGLCAFEFGPGHTTHFTSADPILLETGGVRGDGLSGMHGANQSLRLVLLVDRLPKCFD